MIDNVYSDMLLLVVIQSVTLASCLAAYHLAVQCIMALLRDACLMKKQTGCNA